MFDYEPRESPDDWPEPTTGSTKRENETRPTGTQTLATDIFTPDEAMRLVAARGRYVRGELDECTDEHRRLLFSRWLYEHGKITG